MLNNIDKFVGDFTVKDHFEMRYKNQTPLHRHNHLPCIQTSRKPQVTSFLVFAAARKGYVDVVHVVFLSRAYHFRDTESIDVNRMLMHSTSASVLPIAHAAAIVHRPVSVFGLF